MTKIVFVTYLIGLSIFLTSAYDKKCATGPEYWCQSLQTAEDCGAIRHCTDTTWQHDEKHATVDSSTSCEWCQKILENAHSGIQHLANDENLIKQTLARGCELFPFADLAQKCKNIVSNYGNVLSTLAKAKRYGTICRLMSVCSAEQPRPKEEPIVDQPMLGSKRCTWGPAYWCASLSNSRECSSMEHCSERVWSKQSIEKKPGDNICQYCQFTIGKLRAILEEKQTVVNAEKWLSGACSMLPNRGLIDECVKTMSTFADEILILIKTNVDPGMICHLSQMCKDSTIITRLNTDDETVEESETSSEEQQDPPRLSIDEESKMLCHAIVRATHDLHENQQKTRSEIETFLQDDCRQLPNAKLIEKCETLVDRYGQDIYGHVVSKIELSKVCDYLDDFADHANNANTSPAHCELCTFVLSTAKYMLNANQAEEKVLSYIDEQVCSRMSGLAKKNCKDMVLNKGKEVLDNIRSETKPMLLCTYFQVCIDQLMDKTSPISQNEYRSFLKVHICEKLGTYRDACNALMNQDTETLMKTVVQDFEGDVLCHMFGVCPKKMSFLDNWAVKDDTNKCKRCIDDFTRRKHIAEKLVNHSAEFLQHLCGQLPEKDKCTQAVQDSINELISFVRSLDPNDICVQLKMCDKETLKSIQPTILASPPKALSEHIIEYVKVEFCSKLGPLAAICNKTMDDDGPAILANISKDIDPKKACATIGVCPSQSTFENCNDKCECCTSRIDAHQNQVTTFLHSMVGSVRGLCQHMPNSEKCMETTRHFDTRVTEITSQFDSKSACKMLSHCSSIPVKIETLSQCQTRIQSKQQFLLDSVTSINQNLKSLCEYIPWNKDCYHIIDRSTLDVQEKLKQMDSEKLCSSGQALSDYLCEANSPFGKLCKQLVQGDENNVRLEAIFKSMFNQNGNMDKELCELEVKAKTSDCVPPQKLADCKDKCDCCVKFYTTKKDYDLKTIESLRGGLLATCDWSLTKEYCISWFNRVCDRMKAKVDEFTPINFCKQTGFCPIEEQINQDECGINGDKCQCCTNRLTTRQNRFLTTVNDVTTSLLSFCMDDTCRSMVQSAQQKTLSKIGQIRPQTICQRYGSCPLDHSSQLVLPQSRLSSNPYHHIGSSIEAMDQRLETGLNNEFCFQFGLLIPLCEHLFASTQGHRYLYVYKALLKENPKLFDDDLREQLATKPNADVCTMCKNAVQSTKDFWISTLQSVRDSLIRTCERCPEKDKCRDYYNRRFDDAKKYIDGFDPNQFCQSVHLCSSTAIIEKDHCSTCVDGLNNRKENLLRAVTRLTSYFDDICQRFELKPCQVFVQQVKESFQTMIKNFDTTDACKQIGFCSTTGEQLSTMSFSQYEQFLQEEISNEVCSKFGPFDSLCRQVMRGNSEQVQTVKINYNMRDLMQIGEEKGTNLLSASSISACDRDRCQCCINRIDAKKNCVKNMIDNVFSALSKSCDYCPSKDRCRQFWKDAQSNIHSCIDSWDSKQICVRLGFCSASKLCAKMGRFQERCEEVLNKFTQSSNDDLSLIEQHLPHTSVVVLPSKQQQQLEDHSNSTCILCEYFMKILSNYIHQRSSQQEIEQSLEKICQQMPGPLRTQCDEFVDNFGASIIATLINNFDLSTLCRKLNLCTKQMVVDVSHLTKADVASCGICDYVSTYVHFAMKRDPSDRSVSEALNSVCDHLNNEQESQCKMIVELFRPQIRTLKLNLGGNFCQQLTICQTPKDGNEKTPSVINPPKEEENIKQKVLKNLDDGPQCTLCRYVISYLDAALKNNKSEEAIEAALAKVCGILPTKERVQCNQFVKTYGPVLAELISEMADPETVCRYLGMCQVVLPVEATEKTPLIGSGDHDYVHLSMQNTPFTCTICQFVVSRMKHFAALNQTEEEIVQSLKQSCDLFTVLNLKQQCRDFVDRYVPYLAQMISSDVDAKVACQSIDACEKNTQVPTATSRPQSTPASTSSPTNYGRCIFGMSYWCTSRQNAELCNAVELCERQVWSKKNKNIII